MRFAWNLWAKFDPPTLPRGILPDVIEAFAFDQGLAMGGDMSGIAAGALAVCAAAIPDRIQLQVKKHNSGWLESARLWVALVGPVSAMKSPILGTVVRPLRRIDSDMARENQRNMDSYKNIPGEERKQTDPPKQPRLLMQDTTIEAAQETLKDSPDGVLCFQDELSGWFGSMDKYSSGRGSAKDRAFWLEAYNGAPYTVSRIGRGTVFIENLSVSILGGIQPEPIRKLAEDSVDDGLLQRLVPIVLRPAEVGQDVELSQAVADYAALVNKLHCLQPPLTSGLMPSPTTLRFDDAALVKLGNLTNLSAAGSIGRTIQTQTADQFATGILPVLQAIQKHGASSLTQIADALNERGLRSATGGKWHRSAVRNLLVRARSCVG